MEIKKIICSLEKKVKDPSKGLPEDVFLFISRLVPMTNVDLLIKNKKGQTLMTWRDDEYCSSGWHIPGGLIRYKEAFAGRINTVARLELGAKVKYDPEPVAVNELIYPKLKSRVHTISLLYKCTLITTLDKSLKYKTGAPKKGEWAWFSKCPVNIILGHEIYRKYF